jgi:hypothetical protein
MFQHDRYPAEPSVAAEPRGAAQRHKSMKLSSWPGRPAPWHLLPSTLCLVAVAACGSVPGTATAKPSHTPPPAKVSLNVVVTPSPGAKPERWTLRCDPAGGTHPDATAACRQLLAAKNPFAPIPRGIMCPMIVSGPQKATITGTFFGRHVAATFSRLDGCASVRWSELGHVLAPGSGTGTGTGTTSGSGTTPGSGPGMNGSPVH